MRKRLMSMLTAGFLAVGLVACSEDDLMGPSQAQNIEAELAVDQELTNAIISDAEAALDAVSGVQPSISAGVVGTRGALFAVPDPTRVEEARALLEQAREKYAQARAAYEAGDTETAAQCAEEARRLIAQAMLAVFGEEAVVRYMERVNNVISWLEERVDGESSPLLNRVRELRDEGQTRWTAGDLEGALERLILALRIAERELTDHRRDEIVQHARLSVFMAHSALQLATEYVGEDITEEQARVLNHAEHVLGYAVRALGEGRYREAFSLAREVVNLSLVAVMWELGDDVNKVQAMIELSNQAITAAEEALANVDRQGFAYRLLEHAKQLQARGLDLAQTDELRRAIHVLWFSATVANGVIQLTS